jgi:hypothetical protein
MKESKANDMNGYNDDKITEINNIVLSGTVSSLKLGRNHRAIIRIQQDVGNHVEFHTCSVNSVIKSQRIIQQISVGDRVVVSGRLTNWDYNKGFKSSIIMVNGISMLSPASFDDNEEDVEPDPDMPPTEEELDCDEDGGEAL